MTDATDCQLLERFVTERDEAAFATLARRHAALVLGVCRRVLRNEHDAEDVFQATFLVLARKAVSIPWQQSVGPWLSGVAYRLALHTRAARRGRERLADECDPEPPARGEDPVSDTVRQELRGRVREELARLPQKYQAPVVLCYLEGKTNEQAARELGWPIGSMSRRLEKARRILRERLTSCALALLLLLLLVLAPFRLVPTSSRAGGDAVCHGQPETEALLRRLAEDRSPAVDREQVVALASEARRLAERLEGRDDWKRDARDLGSSARDLNGAAGAGDPAATQLAAARLYAVCSRCHATSRH